MALPMLINGAECGPVNPLQGLSKRFDADRGVQQDHFTPGRASSLPQAFRTSTSQQAGPSDIHRDAAHFFHSDPRTDLAWKSGGSPTPLDLTTLHRALPSTSRIIQQTPLAASSGWAADFVAQKSTTPQTLGSSAGARQSRVDANTTQGYQTGAMQYGRPVAPFALASVSAVPGFVPQLNQEAGIHVAIPSWDQLFSAHEHAHGSQSVSSSTALPQVHPEPQVSVLRQRLDVGDDLSRTAGLLVEAVQHEANPKFQNSTFLNLMRRVRDREVVIDGQQFVETDGSVPLAEATVDVKGKGRAIERPQVSFAENATVRTYEGGEDRSDRLLREREFDKQRDESMQDLLSSSDETEDPNDVYFRQENEDYIQYWNRAHRRSDQQQQQFPSSAHGQSAEWDDLQADWEAFEATASGIKPLASYSFQANNPYILGDSSRTQQHMMHTQIVRSESVLELEAAVQREPTDSRAWFELGVKQQENERELKAIEALRRALELDPTHLPAWLALAVSYTNESDRHGAHDAVQQWVTRHASYAEIVTQYMPQGLQGKPENLLECLMAMARTVPEDGIDADVQIALAVLLNTDEEYEKAQDCFRTALSVRPEDWLLYNRVGATLANSGRAEEALEFYARALELNPLYIRARFNLGISCINLKRYEEGGQYILDALNFQASDAVQGDSSGGVTSAALWDTLKTACLHLQRLDLASLCDTRDLNGLRSNFQQM